MRGLHAIKFWSRTQQCVSTSSAESELIALAKGVSELRGLQHRAREWALLGKGVAVADSSAALGFVARAGAGRLRHVKLAMLWLQEQSKEGCELGRVEFWKVAGVLNPADCLTKPLAREALDRYLSDMGFERRDGRAGVTPAIS